MADPAAGIARPIHDKAEDVRRRYRGHRFHPLNDLVLGRNGAIYSPIRLTALPASTNRR